MKLPWYLVGDGMAVRPRRIYLLWLALKIAPRVWCEARTDRWPVNALTRFRWFRRWIGGHWECWWLDVVHVEFWFRCEHGGERPVAICRGTPICEDWP